MTIVYNVDMVKEAQGHETDDMGNLSPTQAEEATVNNLTASFSQLSLDDKISAIWQELCTVNPAADPKGYEAFSFLYDDLCLERDLNLLWQD